MRRAIFKVQIKITLFMIIIHQFSVTELYKQFDIGTEVHALDEILQDIYL